MMYQGSFVSRFVSEWSSLIPSPSFIGFLREFCRDKQPDGKSARPGVPRVRGWKNSPYSLAPAAVLRSDATIYV